MSNKTTLTVQNDVKADFMEVLAEMQDHLGLGKLSQNDAIRHLITNYNDAPVTDTGFTAAENATIATAAKQTGLPAEMIITRGAMKYAAKLIANQGVVSKADVRMETGVAELMVQNEKAKHWYDKIEINQTGISHRIGGNRQTIRDYIAANREALAAHHKKCKIEPDHNRKVANYKRREANAAARAEAVENDK